MSWQAEFQSRSTFNGTDGIYFAVDVNGLKGPNITGRDCFFIFVSNNGLIDDNASSLGVLPPLSKEQREQLFVDYCKSNGTTGCFGKILNDNWQMTY